MIRREGCPVHFSLVLPCHRPICLPCTAGTTRALRKPHPQTTCRDHGKRYSLLRVAHLGLGCYRQLRQQTFMACLGRYRKTHVLSYGQKLPSSPAYTCLPLPHCLLSGSVDQKQSKTAPSLAPSLKMPSIVYPLLWSI